MVLRINFKVSDVMVQSSKTNNWVLRNAFIYNDIYGGGIRETFSFYLINAYLTDPAGPQHIYEKHKYITEAI